MTAQQYKDNILGCYSSMLAVARRILGNEDEAQDAVQDVVDVCGNTAPKLRYRPIPELSVRCPFATIASMSSVRALWTPAMSLWHPSPKVRRTTKQIPKIQPAYFKRR